MHSLHPELTRALSEMMDKIDTTIPAQSRPAEGVRMFAAGGIALHYHCGTRYTEDVDAVFSHRLLLSHSEMRVQYRREDGTQSWLYLDPTYNDHFALLHPDHRENSVEWQGIGNELRCVKLFVLNPLDLAVSKISRFSPQDHEDILALAFRRYFTADQLRAHALEALDYYVGNTSWVKGTIEILHSELSTEH